MPNRPSVEDRQDFPLLSRRPDWPPLSERPAPDMSFGERQELARFWESRTAAEEASRESWRQSGVAETFAKHVDRDVRTPDPSRLSPPEPDRVEPAPDDFFVAALDVERMEEARAYDRELWSRAVNLNRTREENRLIERAARVSPELQEAMKERLFQLRIDRLRQEDAQKNLEAFATRLDPDLREEFDRHATSRTWDQYPLPEPGPYGRPTAAIELNRARSDMLETYERDPEPDR